jgi:hypothetical protein
MTMAATNYNKQQKKKAPKIAGAGVDTRKKKKKKA